MLTGIIFVTVALLVAGYLTKFDLWDKPIDQLFSPMHRRKSALRGRENLRPLVLDACKHSDEHLLDIRSDAFTKGGLVATLCTACDKQLGPEVYQAAMDRKFSAWILESQTKEEADAAREAKNAELRAEAADLAALDLDLLKYFLSDARESLRGMSWGVSGEQDAKREEIQANCKKWRGELERRGFKEEPSWKRKLEATIRPTSPQFSAGGVVADRIYVPVVPKFDNFAQEVLLPQVDAIMQKTNDRLRAEVQLLEASATRHEEEVEALRVRALEILPTWGRSDWLHRGWKQVSRSEESLDGERFVEMTRPESGDLRILRFHDDDKFWNWCRR